MKHKIIFPTILILFLSGYGAFAQQKNEPEVKGFWQLVSNISDKKTVTVQFYTSEGQLMYQETLHNVKLKAERKKVQRKLNEALKETYQAWTMNHNFEATDLVAKIMIK